VLVLDQITDPHNVGAILRSGGGLRGQGHRHHGAPQPLGDRVLAKSASGALELVPLVTVQNLARALTELNDQGFMTVGLDSQGSETLGAVNPAAGRWRWYWARKARACGKFDARDLQRGGAARTCPARSRALKRLERRGCWRSISVPPGSG